MAEENTSYRNFGLTRRQATFCQLRMQNYSKRKAYMIAFEIDDPEMASRKCWEMEQKYEEQLSAYLNYLSEKVEKQFLMSAHLIQSFWEDFMLDETKTDKDRLKASEYLAKSLAMFDNKVLLEGNLDIKQIIFEGEEKIAD